MKIDCFDVSKNSRIVIYSAGIVGQQTVDKLIRADYHVECIIDQKPPKMKYNDIQIISLSDVISLKDIDNLVVFICLQNGLLHEHVAETLYGYGVRKMLFIPKDRNLEVMQEYRKKYRSMISGEFDDLVSIPYYSSEKNKNIICETRNNIVFWCPYKSLYYRVTQSGNSQKGQLIYSIAQIDYLKEYFELFDYLRGEGTETINYMIHQGFVTAKEQEKMLQDRKRLYEMYEYAIKYDPSFFIESPARCEYRENGRFCIIDGVHRTIYLYINGYEKIPIQVSRKDYESYKATRTL